MATQNKALLHRAPTLLSASHALRRLGSGHVGVDSHISRTTSRHLGGQGDVAALVSLRKRGRNDDEQSQSISLHCARTYTRDCNTATMDSRSLGIKPATTVRSAVSPLTHTSRQKTTNESFCNLQLLRMYEYCIHQPVARFFRFSSRRAYQCGPFSRVQKQSHSLTRTYHIYTLSPLHSLSVLLLRGLRTNGRDQIDRHSHILFLVASNHRNIKSH
jgi:hypothetical protein